MATSARPTATVLARALGHLRRHGLASLAHAGWARLDDRWYDLRRGTDTAGTLGLEGLAIPHRHKAHGIYYGPTQRGPFRHLLRTLALPTDATFVDVGCGKGKALLMALEHGFPRVRGLDFSAELCAVARRNLAIVQRRRGLAGPAEVLHCDATEYDLQPDERVFYLFNPFDALVMAGFVDNLVRSLARHPRPIWLIYCHPDHAPVIEARAPFLRPTHRHVRGTPFAVYTGS